jgi:hypothetical protein
MAKCQGFRKDGKRCGMHAGADGWCVNHRPGSEAEKARYETARAGGRVGRARTRAPEDVTVKYESAADVTCLLASVTAWVLTGAIDSKVANAAVYAASAALRSLDQGEIEKQLDELRSEIESLKRMRAA